MSTVTVEYVTNNIRAIEATSHTNEKTGKRSITGVMIDGQKVDSTDRFWNSLFSRYGFGKNIFNYYTPEEVFERISEKRADDRVRFCMYKSPGMVRPQVLAVSNPQKPVMHHDQALELLTRYEPLGGVKYAKGILRADYTPRGEAPFEVGGDKFQARFSTMIPIDGYGVSEVSLGCLRLICTNGMVAFGNVFSNKIPGGSDADGGFARITQTIEGYGNDEGFDALRRRLGSASESYASVAECGIISKAVMKALGATSSDKEQVRDLLSRFDRVAGNPIEMYGLVSQTSVGKKRLATLPSRASVYDLINFSTEVATHHVDSEERARGIYGVIGDMIGKEFDLEGSARNGRDFIDLYIDGEDHAAKRAEKLTELTEED